MKKVLLSVLCGVTLAASVSDAQADNTYNNYYAVYEGSDIVELVKHYVVFSAALYGVGVACALGYCFWKETWGKPRRERHEQQQRYERAKQYIDGEGGRGWSHDVLAILKDFELDEDAASAVIGHYATQEYSYLKAVDALDYLLKDLVDIQGDVMEALPQHDDATQYLKECKELIVRGNAIATIIKARSGFQEDLDREQEKEREEHQDRIDLLQAEYGA